MIQTKSRVYLWEKTVLTMKRVGAIESESVKSARKAKDKLHKACERALETREWTLHGQEQNNAHGKHERVTRQWSIYSQHTSTITCTAAPRVWHFHYFSVTRLFANISTVQSPALCNHRHCAIIRTVQSSALCNHPRCAITCTVQSSTLCNHLHCAIIHTVQSFLQCYCKLQCLRILSCHVKWTWKGSLKVGKNGWERQQLWKRGLTLCLQTERQSNTDCKLVKLWFLINAYQAAYSNAFLYFPDLPVSSS